MEKIFLDWISDYIGTNVHRETKFQDLNFDIFDESVTVDFIKKQFDININKKELWYETIKDLIEDVVSSTSRNV